MNMEFTATTDLQRATTKDANGKRKHNEHDPNVKHDNVQIIKEDTELNQHTVLLSRDKLLEQQYGAMIKKRNDATRQRFLNGKIGQAEYQKRLTNIDKYLNDEGKQPKQAFTTYVFTLGNVDTEFKLLDALGFKYERQKVKDEHGNVHDRPKLTDPKQRKEFADIMNETYVNLAKRINHTKGSGIKVVDVWTHMDEGGMPHGQGEIVNMGHTATGKPSYNLNQALGEFNKTFGKDVYVSRSTNKQGKKSKSPNGRIAMKEFRSIIDTNLVQTFNDALKKHGLDKKVTASMIRLGRKGGYSMEEYQARKQANKDLSDVYETVVGHKPKGPKEKVLTPLEMAHGVSKAVKKSKKDKEQADIAKADAEQKAKDLQKQVDDLTSQRNQLQQRLNDLNSDINSADEKLQQRRRQRRQQAQEELEANNEIQFNQPVTDKNVSNAEQAIDNYRLNKSKQFKADKAENAKLQSRLNKNRVIVRRLDSLDKQAKAEGLSVGKVITDRQRLLGQMKAIGKAFAVMERTASLAVSFMKGQAWAFKDPSLNTKGEHEPDSKRALTAAYTLDDYDNQFTKPEERKKMEDWPVILERKAGDWLKQQFERVYHKSPIYDNSNWDKDKQVNEAVTPTKAKSNDDDLLPG